MMTNDDLTSKLSDKKMEKDEGLKTLECLRGRLLAERAASKAANDESEQIAKKVTELENQLKMEIKSRNKAEKRLKFLMEKFHSLNISASESSSFSEKSEISSVSSSKSQEQMDLQKTQFKNSSKCEVDTTICSKRHDCPSYEHDLGSFDEAISGNSHQNVILFSQEDGDEDDLKKDDNNGLNSPVTKTDIDNEEYNKDEDDSVDNSMALVVVEDKAITTNEHGQDYDDSFNNSMAIVVVDSMAKQEEKEELPISNGNVKDVLDALRCARESLQNSMEMRRHMRSNMAQGRLNGISC